MRGGDEELVHEVLVLGAHAHPAAPAAVLGAVRGDRGALDVAPVRYRDRHVLLGDHVLHGDVFHRVHDHRAARVAVVVADLLQLVGDDLVDAPGLAEDVLQVRDEDLDLLQLVDDLLPLEAGEPLELHLEDRVGLDLAEAEAAHEAGARLRRRLRLADEGDHLVEVVEGDDEAFEDVGPRLGLSQLEGRPPAHDLAAELDEQLRGLEQVQDLRPLVDDREHDDPERVLERRELVEVVQDHLARLALADVHDDPHALPGALVADVGDAVDPLLAHELGDPLDEARLVDLVGDLGDDDRFLVPLAGLDLRPRPHHDRSPPGAVGLADAGPAADEAGGGEVGARDPLHEPFQPLVGREVRVLDEERESVDDFPEVVGRDLRGHADRDPLRSVDEQVGEHGGKDRRLLRLVVVGGLEIDGVLVDVQHHRGAHAREPRFGVSHRRRRVAVDGAEVALAVHERRAHVPVLGHAHEGVVDRPLAVRVVLAHHVAGDPRALLVGSPGLEAHLVHAEEHPTVRGLEAVPHVGQGAADDHGHGVVHVGLAHLVRDVRGDLLEGYRILLGSRHVRCPGSSR